MFFDCRVSSLGAEGIQRHPFETGCHRSVRYQAVGHFFFTRPCEVSAAGLRIFFRCHVFWRQFQRLAYLNARTVMRVASSERACVRVVGGGGGGGGAVLGPRGSGESVSERRQSCGRAPQRYHRYRSNATRRTACTHQVYGLHQVAALVPPIQDSGQ